MSHVHLACDASKVGGMGHCGSISIENVVGDRFPKLKEAYK